MSEFLLNVARRGAGLSPVIRARDADPAWPPAADEPDAVTVADSDGIAPAREMSPQTVAAAAEPTERLLPAARADDTPSPVVARGEHAPPLPAPAIQRTVATPSSAPVVTGTPAAPVVLSTPSTAVVLSTPLPAAYVASPVPGPAPLPSASETSTGRVAEPAHTPIYIRVEPAHLRPDASTAAAPATWGAAVVEGAPAEAPNLTRHEALEREIVPMQVIRERVAVLLERNLPDGGDVRLAAAAPAPVIEGPPPERSVHVRIGTIEIHGSPASPAPAAPGVTPPLPSAGFDEFARLRAYAPWDR